MAAPVLLVADDLSLIAAVKRVLAREGFECVLATSAADAIIAYGHALPGLLLLQPSVESDRGAVVLEELKGHPDAQLLKVLLLGETIPGFGFPVEPLPIDPEHLSASITENFRAQDSASGWEIREPAEVTPPSQSQTRELEPWRATRLEAASMPVVEEELPPLPMTAPSVAPVVPPPAFTSGPSFATLERNLFGDLPSLEDELHRDIEAEALASVESTLAQQDEELRRLEDEVRAEAQRRREAQQPPEVLPPPVVAPAGGEFDLSGEQSFAELEPEGQPPAPPESRAAHTLARAEQMLLEVRAVAEAHRRADEAEARRTSTELEAVTRRAEHAESLVRREQDVRAQLEAQLEALQGERAQLVDQLSAEQQAHDALASQLAQTAGAVHERDEQLAELARRRDDRIAELTRSREERFAELNRQQADAVSALTRRNDEQLAQLRGELAEAEAARDVARTELAEASKHWALLEQERAAHQATRAALEQAQTATADLGTERAAHASTRLELMTARAELDTAQTEASNAALANLQLEDELAAAAATLAAVRAALEAGEQAQREAREATAHVQAELEQERTAHEQTRRTLELSRAEVAVLAAESAQLVSERAAHEATRRALAEAQELVGALESERTQLEAAHAETEQRQQAAQVARVQLETELQALRERVADLEPKLTGATELVEEASLQRQRVEGELTETATALAEARAAVAQHEADEVALRDELERAAARQAVMARELAELKDALETMRTRVEQAEALANLASEKMRELEARETMPLALPGRKAPLIARHGAVDLEGLARLFRELVSSAADVRVELGAAGGTRTLWLKKGHIIAASSTFDSESLIDRARRDGLIDARQEAELRMLRTATLREQLDALKARGFIRDAEAVPLVQRAIEHLALEALAEESTQYRLTDEPPGLDVTSVTMPRATLPILAEALRRAVPSDSLLERLGGGEAVPLPPDSDWDLRALGFTDRERKMLSWIDGEATVEDVSLASGLKPDAAFRALLVARLMGVIDVKLPEVRAPAVDAELEVRRLEAKYDEVHDADYFSVLGLERSAGADDVRRAWQRLSAEFHPLRFSGHPDAGLQQRAQVVYSLLEEAARALEDDRRRAEYARHLLD